MSTDYSTVEIPDPDEEPPSEWHYTARRAWLLQEVSRRGSPAAINQSEMAERLGVSQPTVSRDLDAVAEHIATRAGGDRATATAVTVFERAVAELMADGEYMKAVRACSTWMDWLQDTGRQQTAPERQEVALTGADTQRFGEEGGPGYMSEQNREHFETLAEQANETTQPLTKGRDSNPGRDE